MAFFDFLEEHWDELNKLARQLFDMLKRFLTEIA